MATKRAQTKIRPEQKTGEPNLVNKHWRGLFLDTLAETSNVSEAARTAGINPSRAYKVRREEPDFSNQWHDALIEGYAHLEMEILHRLRVGTGKDDNKFDMANALRLLVLHRDTVARERALRGSGDKASVLASLTAKFETMRTREAEIRQMFAEEEELQDGHDDGD